MSSTPPPEPSGTLVFPRAGRWRTTALYALLLAVAGGVVFALWVAAHAPGGAGGPPGTACATGTEKSAPLAALLVAIATITLAARGVGAFFERFLRQPAVMGEIAAGIMLGPSVLGAVAPGVQAVLFAPEAVPYLGAVAKLGVVLFMFLVGLEVDPGHLRGQARATLAVSHASMAIPFALGAALTPWLYGPYAGARTDVLVFGLFLGISLAVTAFPVLARLLQDRGETRTTLGATALALAALGDATAWFLLAVISGLARAGHVDPWPMLGAIALFGGATAFGLRPLLRWLSAREARRGGDVSRNVLARVFSLLLLSAVATELIGIHALFGAFAFGVVIPHDARLAEQLRARMESLVGVLLLPVFFAYTGLRTEIGLVDTGTDVLLCAVIVGVATLGKLGGTALGARLMGMPARDALALGVLMNTRGLMELIVLNVGLDMGVLSPTLFAMLVLMALVTTFATAPLYDRVRRSPEP